MKKPDHCIYGCKTDGTPCPRPHTCHTLGAQAVKSIKPATCCTGNCQQGKECPERECSFETPFWIILATFVIALIIAPALAGYLYEITR